jgi:hypothetical protein
VPLSKTTAGRSEGSMAGGDGGCPPAHISSAAARGSMGGRGLPRSLGRIGEEEDAAAAAAAGGGIDPCRGGWGELGGFGGGGGRVRRRWWRMGWLIW